jgi:hypothetical protein
MLIRIVALTLFALAATARAADAGPLTLDQAFQPSLVDHGRLEGVNRFAQTFDVGLTGMFTAVDLAIGREVNPLAVDDLVLSIVRASGGGPTDNLVANLTLPSSHWVLRDTFIDSEAYRRVEFEHSL